MTEYRREVEGDAEALLLLGLIALFEGDRDHAYDILSRATALTVSWAVGNQLLDWPVREPRIRHDYEQLELLEQRGKLGESAARALSVLKRYYPLTGDPGGSFAPEGEEAATLRRALVPIHHRPDVPFAGRALGENDYRRLEDQYRDTRPSVVVIDNFLSAEALAALRQFAEEATVWKVAYKSGYHAALLSTGFCPRVLLAIADELRRAMPEVVGPHPLWQAWGFKYDQRMQGTALHADFARVNVNFWITPDGACDDHEVGGMLDLRHPRPGELELSGLQLGGRRKDQRVPADQRRQGHARPLPREPLCAVRFEPVPRDRHVPIQARLHQSQSQRHVALRYRLEEPARGERRRARPLCEATARCYIPATFRRSRLSNLPQRMSCPRIATWGLWRSWRFWRR